MSFLNSILSQITPYTAVNNENMIVVDCAYQTADWVRQVIIAMILRGHANIVPEYKFEYKFQGDKPVPICHT